MVGGATVIGDGRDQLPDESRRKTKFVSENDARFRCPKRTNVWNAKSREGNFFVLFRPKRRNGTIRIYDIERTQMSRR